MSNSEVQKYWNGKRVLVTGGTSGLGRALVLQLVELGARVAVVSRRGGAPAGIVAIQADVSEKRDIYRIAGEAHLGLGGVDVLFNNASGLGALPRPLLQDTECEDFENVLQTNLLGPFRLTKALLPGMVLRRSGLVINITSDAGVNAYAGWGSYGVSKAALGQMSRIWADEMLGQGVRFLEVDPGDMDTPMHEAALPGADRSLLKRPEDSAREILEKAVRGVS